MQQSALAVTTPQPARRRQRRPDSPAPAPSPARRLWLCVDFPALAVDVLQSDPAVPAAAVETVKSRAAIAAANGEAAGRGIVPGMALPAARSVCAGLVVQPRCAETEHRFMRAAAERLMDYSSQVALYGPAGLVVEIKGSLRLFGGLAALLERIDGTLREWSVAYQTGVAPTARAAQWLARYRPGTVVEKSGDLKTALRPLPAAVLCESRKQRQRLERSGIRTLGDILRLPRADAARRFGGAFYRPLDEALGARAEALDCFRPPPVFEAAEAFVQATDNAHWIAGAGERLLEKLERFLSRRQCAVQQLQCSLYHEREAPTRLSIGTARPAARAAHLSSLFNERLEGTALPAPVTHIAIRADELLEPAVVHYDLFETAAARREWDELIERLVTRLGPDAVQCLSVKADHRPEYAHHRQTIAETGSPDTTARARPLWLLERAAGLAAVGGRLYWNRQPLRLLPGVERIEQGWWSGDDVRRDYRVALTAGHARLWVFQDLRSRAWYLHGIFG